MLEHESFSVSAPESVGSEEDLERKKAEQKGKTLETAFEFTEGEEPFIDQETAKQIKLYNLAEFLIFGERTMEEDEEKDFYYVNRTERLMERAPKNPEMIKLRQELLVSLTSQAEGDPEKKLDQIKTLQKLIERGLLRELNFDLDPHLEEGREGEKAIEFNLGYLDYYFGKLPISPQKSIEEVEKTLALIPGQSVFLEQLKNYLKDARPALEAYKKRLQESGIVDKFKLIQRFFETKDEELLRKTGFRNSKEYQIYLRDLSEKGEALEHLQRSLSNFVYFLEIARAIIEHNLKPVEIKDGNSLELKDARHPFLLRDLRGSKVVPIDVVLTPEKPNVIITGDNATGKTKYVETVLLNASLIQAIGFGFVEKGHYSPREKITYQRAQSSEIEQSQYSRGQMEMQQLVEEDKKTRRRGLAIRDEVLTSTDSMGAIAIVIAVLEADAEKGGMNLLTIHSRDLKKIEKLGLAPSIKFVRAKKGKEKYHWEDGIGRADPIVLAEEAGLSKAVIKKAKEILAGLERSE